MSIHFSGATGTDCARGNTNAVRVPGGRASVMQAPASPPRPPTSDRDRAPVRRPLTRRGTPKCHDAPMLQRPHHQHPHLPSCFREAFAGARHTCGVTCTWLRRSGTRTRSHTSSFSDESSRRYPGSSALFRLRFFLVSASLRAAALAPGASSSKKCSEAVDMRTPSCSNRQPSFVSRARLRSTASPLPHVPLNPPMQRSAATTRCHGTASHALTPAKSGARGFFLMH